MSRARGVGRAHWLPCYCRFCRRRDQRQQQHTISVSPPPIYKGDVWHVALEGLPGSGVLYAFRVEGDGGWETGYRWAPDRALLDPRAPLVAGRRAWRERDALERFELDRGSQWWGTFDFDGAPFDWGDDETVRPREPLKDLVIYEMSVRCFTADASSGVAPERRGTYLGVVDKVCCVSVCVCVCVCAALCAAAVLCAAPSRRLYIAACVAYV